MTQILRYDRGGVSLGEQAVAIGVFDGVHLGHQALIADTIAAARDLGIGSCVITFDRDPECVVCPDHAARQLMLPDDKIATLAGLGPDTILVIPFDERLAALSPEEFLSGVLLDALDPRVIVVGADFRFGARAAGTVETLHTFAEPRDAHVVAHELIAADGAVVTATRVRALVAEGDVVEAARLLGRPHYVRGTVVRGRGIGATIGVPTANLDHEACLAIPAPGVYAGQVSIAGVVWPAAVTTGTAPTFPGGGEVVEVHIIGYSGDLYGSTFAVEFTWRLRDQRRFDSVEDLRAAIAQDIECIAREFAG